MATTIGFPRGGGAVVMSDGWIGDHRASLAMLAIVSLGGWRVAGACWNLARQGSGWSLDLVDWGESAVHSMIETGLQNG